MAEPASMKQRSLPLVLTTGRSVGWRICRSASHGPSAVLAMLPFVARLACADKPDIERERASYIEAHTPMFFSFEEGVQTLEGALAIGRQADPLGTEEVNTRFEVVQDQATRATSMPDSHLFFKTKGWFESVSEAIG